MDCESIAFPQISSGIYGYPRIRPLQIAVAAIRSSWLQHEMNGVPVVYDRQSLALSEKQFYRPEKFIDDHYV